VLVSCRKLHPYVVVLLFGLATPATAQQEVDVDAYVQIVLRSHPAGRLRAGFEDAARAERKATRQFPDPEVEYSRGRAHPNDEPSARAMETGLSVSQTLPWPGAFVAGARAGARAADALRAEGTASCWEIELAARRAFARLVTTRALLDIDRATEEDARSLRDLVTRRAELGETRDSDRIKATVEWMRQRRFLQASQRDAEAAEAVVRTLAVEPLPRPLALRADSPRDLPTQSRESLAARLLDLNPEILAARAAADRHRALAAQAKQARVPDLDVTVFRDKELDKSSTGFALGIRVPLWNANRGEIARSEASLKIAAAEADRKRLDLLAELEERLKDLEVAGAQVQALDKEILPSAGDSLRLARRSYEEGETSLLDLLDAQRTLRETQREAVESRLALALAVADIQRLVGPAFDPWR
jgi:outer membrane protein, heavy metal efflux system